MSSNIINLLWESFLETILMVGVSGGLGAAIGIPLGVFLFVTSPKGIMPKPYVNRIIGTVVNAVRSTPFIPQGQAGARIWQQKRQGPFEAFPSVFGG